MIVPTVGAGRLTVGLEAELDVLRLLRRARVLRRRGDLERSTWSSVGSAERRHTRKGERGGRDDGDRDQLAQVGLSSSERLNMGRPLRPPATAYRNTVERQSCAGLAGSCQAAASFGSVRAPEHAIPAPPVPARADVGQRRAAADGQAARAARARRVLGLLPRQLAADAPLPEGVARALRGRRAARDRRPHGRVPARRASTENVVAAVERLGIEYPVVIDERLEIWDFYGNEGWPARYLWDPEGALYSLHYGEGAYQETEREIQALLGVERPLLEPLRPEDAEGDPAARPDRDQPGAYSGPYEAGGVWAVLEGRGEVTVNGRALAVDGPGCYPLVEHARHTQGVLDLQARRRRDLPRHVLHAGASQLRVGPVPQQPDEPRRPAVLDHDRGARPVGRRVRRVARGSAAGRPTSRCSTRASARLATPTRRRPATGRSGACARTARAGRRSPSRRSTSRIPRRPPRRSAAPDRSRSTGPSPSALIAATALT